MLGTKAEDTVYVQGGRVENLTASASWPAIKTVVNGRSYSSPDIRVRPLPAGEVKP